MIKGYCRTNLDGYSRVSWPTKFVSVPEIGHRVLSIDSNNSLKVVAITHFMTKHSGTKSEACIEVELNK